jgi:RNA polymerase sigma-70 factor (ECF subfamily)
MNVYDGLQVSEISIKLGEKYKYIENKLGTARKTVRGYVQKMLA